MSGREVSGKGRVPVPQEEDMSQQEPSKEFIDVDVTSCILSYTALRRRKTGKHHRLETFAEEVFFSALVFMVLICLFIAYEFI